MPTQVIEIKSLVGAKLLVRKCFVDDYRDQDGRLLLYRTEKSREQTNWAEVLMVGAGCKEFREENVGDFVVAHEQTLGRVGPAEFIIAEKAIEPYVYRNEA